MNLYLPAFLVLVVFGTAPAVADEWTDCAEEADTGPPSAVLCFFRIAQSLEDLGKARAELETRSALRPEDPYLTLTLALVIERAVGCGESRPLFSRAAELFAALGVDKGQFSARSNVARCLDQLGLIGAARVEARRLHVLAEKMGDPLLLAKAVLRETQVALSSGELIKAEEKLQAYPLSRFDPLDTSGQLGDDWLFQHGLLNHILGRWPEALRDYEALAERAQNRNEPLKYARAVYNLAATRTSFEVTEDNRLAVREAASVALEAAEVGGDAEVLIRALLLKGRLENDDALLIRCGRLAEDSGNWGQLAVCKIAESAAIATTQPAYAERLLAEGIAATARSQDLLIPLYAWKDQLRAAFALRPRAEALAAAHDLLAQIERVRSSENRSERRAELFGVWRELYSWLAGRLLERGDPLEEQRAFLLLEQARARELHEALAIPPSEVRGLREAEAGLDENEAMLTFHLGSQDLYGHEGDGSAVFISTRQGTKVLELPYRTTLAPALDIWLGSIEARTDDVKLASSMGKLLFGPIEKLLPPNIDRLVVVPDGCLYRLPWALLRDSRGELLVERYEIRLSPSASLASRHAGNAAQPGNALVFADPAFASSTRHRSLPRLPMARREGEEVHRLIGGELLEAEGANEEALRLDSLGPYAVLHFAAHAVLDSELPENSALLLAPQGAEDGRLEPREIAHLDLGGQLVTLAACRSARGRILPGEGPMSLGRAFLAAGAPAVLGSLWPLRDDEAFGFFSRFYRHLGKGERASSALAATQREMAAAGEPAAAWAGVVLLGDGDFRLEARSPAPRIPLAWLFLLPAAILGLWWLRRLLPPRLSPWRRTR